MDMWAQFVQPHGGKVGSALYMRSYKNIALIFFLMALTIIVSSACGKKKSETTKTPDPVPTEPPRGDDNQNNDFSAPANIRICPDQLVQNLSLPALEAYMFPKGEYSIDPDQMEDGASWCLKLYGTSKFFDAALRIEFEHAPGVHSYNLLSQYVVYSEIKDGNIHILWLDDAGFIELKGSRQPNSQYRARIRFANLPELSEVKTQGVGDVYSDFYEKCKNGTYSFSQCMGTHIIVYPSWPQNNGQLTTSQLLQYANEYLNGQHGADAHTLGYIYFKLSDVVVNQ